MIFRIAKVIVALLACSALASAQISSTVVTSLNCVTELAIKATTVFTTTSGSTTKTTTYTSPTTTVTLAAGLPKKVTATTVARSTVTVNAPTQTRTSTFTITGSARVVTVTPSPSIVSITTVAKVTGPASSTTIIPPSITSTSTAITTLSPSTATTTITVGPNAAKEKRINGPKRDTNGERLIERGAVQLVFCERLYYTVYYVPTTVYKVTAATYVSTTVTSTTTLTATFSVTNTPTTVITTTITSNPAPTTVTLASSTITATSTVTQTLPGSVVTVTATASTTNVLVTSTVTPAPTTTTITVTTTTTTSSTSSAGCTPPVLTDNSGCLFIPSPDDTADYDDFYSGSGFTENLDNLGNQDFYPQAYTVDYPCSLDACSAITACADNAYDADYYSFDLHFFNSSQTWECVVFYNLGETPADYNVPNDDVVVAYGYSCNDCT